VVFLAEAVEDNPPSVGAGVAAVSLRSAAAVAEAEAVNRCRVAAVVARTVGAAAVEAAVAEVEAATSIAG
jgi:hypothetical protein